jgi:hypothetical protein
MYMCAWRDYSPRPCGLHCGLGSELLPVIRPLAAADSKNYSIMLFPDYS